MPAAALHAQAQSMFSKLGSSKAKSTWDKYTGHWRAYETFCARFGFDPDVSNPDVAALFLNSVFEDAQRRRVGPQSVEGASAALTAYFELRGQASPCTSDRFCCMLREAARRTLVPRQLDREGVTPEDMQQLVQTHIKPACSLFTRMIVTAALLCYYGALRFSDLARIHVHHEMMRLVQDAQLPRAELFLMKAKNDQHGQGAWVVIQRLGGAACPVANLERLLQHGRYKRRPRQVQAPDGISTDAEDVGPLLRPVTFVSGVEALAVTAVPLGRDFPAMPYQAFLAALRRLLAEAGIKKAIGTHSFRIGSTSTAINSGADPRLVMKHGRWRDPKVFEQAYARDALPQRLGVTKAMAALPNLSTQA